MRVLVTNVYSHENFGDAAIVHSIIEQVRLHAPDAEITLHSDFWRENEGHYDASSERNVFGITIAGGKLVKLLMLPWLVLRVLAAPAMVRLLPVGMLERLWPSLARYVKADCIFACGGGYLFTSNLSRFSLGLWQHLAHMRLAKTCGTPSVLCPQTIGPLQRDFDRKLVARVLRQTGLIACRDRESERLVRELIGDDARIVFVPDVVFAWSVPQPREPDTRTRILGVTVLDWSWASDAPDREQRVRAYYAAIARVCRWLIESHGYAVRIVPQVVVKGGDVGPSYELLNAIDSTSAAIADEVAAPPDAARAYSECDFVIGSRMHSCIFSLAAGVPVIGLSYQPKVAAMFDQLGLADYCQPADGLDDRALTEICARVVEDFDAVAGKVRELARRQREAVSSFFETVLAAARTESQRG